MTADRGVANMKLLDVLNNVAEMEVVGRTPAFLSAHVLKALELVASGSIGRGQLARELRLGEGTVRTLVGRMKSLGLLETSRSGMTLTEEGTDVIKGFSQIFRGMEIPGTPMTVGEYNYAILVRGASKAVNKGIEQRDAALIAGAKGATTLVFDAGRLGMPGMDRPPDAEILRFIYVNLAPSEGDAIIIGSSDDGLSAEIGARSAALKLLAEMD